MNVVIGCGFLDLLNFKGMPMELNNFSTLFLITKLILLLSHQYSITTGVKDFSSQLNTTKSFSLKIDSSFRKSSSILDKT